MCQFKKALYKCFEHIEFDFDKFLESKIQRIIFQKYGYFFKKYFHLNIGRYNLYINGPYNPELAEVGFELANDKEYYKAKTSFLNLPPKVSQTLDVLKEEFGFDSSLLEVYCTYIYLKDTSGYDQDHSLKVLSEIKSNLIQNRDECSTSKILEKEQNVINQLTQIGII